jgi:hypothetical protein
VFLNFGTTSAEVSDNFVKSAKILDGKSLTLAVGVVVDVGMVVGSDTSELDVDVTTVVVESEVAIIRFFGTDLFFVRAPPGGLPRFVLLRSSSIIGEEEGDGSDDDDDEASERPEDEASERPDDEESERPEDDDEDEASERPEYDDNELRVKSSLLAISTCRCVNGCRRPCPAPFADFNFGLAPFIADFTLGALIASELTIVAEFVDSGNFASNTFAC